MGISMNREKTLEECKRHIDECAALLERISARAAVRLSGVRPTARRYQTGLLFSGSVRMTEKDALRINGVSKFAVICWKHGDDRTHLMVVGCVYDLVQSNVTRMRATRGFTPVADVRQRSMPV